MSPDLWQRGCEQLATELSEQQFNTWIRALPPADLRDDGAAGVVAQVRVPNRFKLDWIRSQYAGRIEGILSDLAGVAVRLELTLAARDPAPPGMHSATPSANANGPLRAAALLNGQAMAPSTSVRPASAGSNQTAAYPGRPVGPAPGPGYHLPPAANSHKLNTALTFDTLVPGRANQMARTAALHVAGAPGVMYNPLFIYGGVGLGKTHLIHAVGNALLQDNPNARVLYLHAEQFISDVVKNYQRKTFDELKAKYHNLDLLLIDDVQFFAGKERTQEEFFNAFEALLAKRAHIIMTSDTYPKGLVDIDTRLTSRFEAGLTVAIEPPELEMRVAILMRKSLAEGTEMPEDVAFFVAKNVRANVRELEGALRKVLAYSRFSHKDINIGLAREALKDLLSIQNRQISVENIQKTVADFYKIKIADMYSKKRPANIAKPRQIAMYLAKEMTQKSLPEIGELFGGRDHTTVLHAVRKIGGDRQKDSELNQQLHVLEQTLKG
jgi:chromosomal replication initiator protein